MDTTNDATQALPPAPPSLLKVMQAWTRLGCIGFGGPPSHISLLRQLCVSQQNWLTSQEFEDAVAATGLLPGPSSTQLAIYCAWKLRGALGALIGGVCFITPGLLLILLLSASFLVKNPYSWIVGLATGAGVAVPIIAVQAAHSLITPSLRLLPNTRPARLRWGGYLLLGGLIATFIGQYLVIILIACGTFEVLLSRPQRPPTGTTHIRAVAVMTSTPLLSLSGGIPALAWVAFKVGALSYGGGFVIVPLMQHDAVQTYHWLTQGQFLSAVALGQLTPGPVVQTVAVIGYAAAGLGGGLLAALIAFTPSFLFVIFGAPHFERLRHNRTVRAFLRGAGPSVIGAIAGSALPLSLALMHLWEIPVLLGVILWLFVLHRGVVTAILLAALSGFVASLVY